MFEDCLGGDDAWSHAVAGSPFVRLMRPKCGGSAARVGDDGVLLVVLACCWWSLGVRGFALVVVDVTLSCVTYSCR